MKDFTTRNEIGSRCTCPSQLKKEEMTKNEVNTINSKNSEIAFKGIILTCDKFQEILFATDRNEPIEGLYLFCFSRYYPSVVCSEYMVSFLR